MTFELVDSETVVVEDIGIHAGDAQSIKLAILEVAKKSTDDGSHELALDLIAAFKEIDAEVFKRHEYVAMIEKQTAKDGKYLPATPAH